MNMKNHTLLVLITDKFRRYCSVRNGSCQFTSLRWSTMIGCNFIRHLQIFRWVFSCIDISFDRLRFGLFCFKFMICVITNKQKTYNCMLRYSLCCFEYEYYNREEQTASYSGTLTHTRSPTILTILFINLSLSLSHQSVGRSGD